jgi:CubicO group peptidase (beta-lactamase class C family)
MKCLIFTITLFWATQAIAQNFSKVKLDSLLSRLEMHQKGMGQLSIFQNGQEIYQKSYGFADIPKQIKINSNTRFRIGSISKIFTAIVILKLVEEKKLSLSSTLHSFYPKIKNAEKITIEQLLRHRSGLFNLTEAADYPTWSYQKLSKEQLLDKIYAFESKFEPNSKTDYSNTNYILLTLIAEKLGGADYSTLIQKYIIKPLQLKNTYVGDKINPKNGEALAYDKLLDWTQSSETDLSVALGAACVVSNAQDLNVVINQLFKAKILKPQTLQEMKKLQDGLGLGLQEAKFGDKYSLGHGGKIDGFQAYVAYFAAENMSIAFTGNGIVYPMYDLLLGATQIYFNHPDYQLPQFITLKSAELDKYLGEYTHPQFPFKLKISKEGNILVAEGGGAPKFGLECFEPNKFKYDPIGLTLEFLPNANKMIFKQGEGVFEFVKE